MGDFTSNRKTVASAGTAVALDTSTRRVRRVFLQAETDNTGLISLGGSVASSVAAAGSQKGRILAAGAALELTDVRLSDIFINATVNGDGVTYLVEGD